MDPQERFLATAAGPEVLIWSASDWRRVRSLPTTNATLCFSGDGSKLVSFGDEGVRLWNTATWDRRLAADQLLPSYKGYRLVALNRDGSLLVLSSGEGMGTEAKRRGEVVLWKLPEREILLKDTQANDVMRLAFADYGRWLAACTYGPPAWIYFWSVAERKPVAKWAASPGLGMALVFAPGSQELVTGGSDQMISRWRTGTTNRLGILSAAAHFMTGRPPWDLYATSGNGCIYAWSAESGMLVYSNKVSRRAFASLGRHGADRRFLIGEDWSKFSFCDIQAGQREVVDEHAVFGAPNSMALSSDERLFAYRTSNNQIRVLESAGDTAIRVMRLPTLAGIDTAERAGGSSP